jgi:carbonic anhydrase
MKDRSSGGAPWRAAFRPRLDFGLAYLRPQWKASLSSVHLREDLLAGVTVASVAIPLSLAIAVASGVPPVLGLISAVVGSIVVACLNGTPLGVSGPAAAIAVLVGAIVKNHGLDGLIFAGLVAGGLQLLTGLFGLGRLVRLTPSTVVHGFTAGIGAIIIVQQLPRALGFPAPDESHILAVLANAGNYIVGADLRSVGIAALVIAIAVVVPKKFPRAPALLLAVIVPSALAALLGLSVPTIGALPSELPSLALPSFGGFALGPLLGDALVLYLVASLETLLSSAAVDRMTPGNRHDPDQELIGQGIGNMVVSCMGGLPVTGVIARSALNVQSGAKTRRSAFFSGFGVLVAVVLLAPFMARIPMAALAGVLLVVGARMVNPSTFRHLLRVSRADAAVFLVTFVVIVGVDLLAGVQAGIAAALVIAAVRLGRSRSVLSAPADGPMWLALRGPLTFLASIQIDSLRDKLETPDLERGLVIDLRAITDVDTSGIEALTTLVTQGQASGGRVALLGARPKIREALLASSDRGTFEPVLAASAADVDELVGKEVRPPGRAQLVRGVSWFRTEHRAELQDVFRQLAKSQKPHTLFITCADSRVTPSLLTGTDPGELFVMRNVGALIPPDGDRTMLSELAGLHYAVEVLGVREIVVCGHSNCGAVGLLMGRTELSNQAPFAEFCACAPGVAGDVRHVTDHDDAVRQVLRRQLLNLMSHAFIRTRVASGALSVHAWFYDVGTPELYEWDASEEDFVPVRVHAA